MKMETKKEIFDRYTKEYLKIRRQKGKRVEFSAIISTFQSVSNMGRKCNIVLLISN